MAISAGNRPLQGTKLLVSIAISRSLGESMMRQPVIPAALQPKPIAIVRDCFPTRNISCSLGIVVDSPLVKSSVSVSQSQRAHRGHGEPIFYGDCADSDWSEQCIIFHLFFSCISAKRSCIRTAPSSFSVFMLPFLLKPLLLLFSFPFSDESV